MLTNNEKQLILKLYKDNTQKYNARTLSKEVAMTPRGALKALNKIKEQNIAYSEEFGKANIYYLNFKNTLTKKMLELFLLEEAELHYKRWVEECKEFSEAECIILFGSSVKDYKKAHDIDMIFIVNKKKYKNLIEKINEKNKILIKKIHPLIQTMHDIENNIREKNPVIIDAIKKGIVLKGQDKIIEVIANVKS